MDTVTLKRALGARPPSLVESEVLPKMEVFPGVNHMAKARIWVDKRVWYFPLGVKKWNWSELLGTGAEVALTAWEDTRS